jgi:hypothetical protein
MTCSERHPIKLACARGRFGGLKRWMPSASDRHLRAWLTSHQSARASSGCRLAAVASDDVGRRLAAVPIDHVCRLRAAGDEASRAMGGWRWQ